MAITRKIFPLNNSIVIRSTGPTDESPLPDAAANPLDNTDDSATCSFKVYDPAKRGTLTAAVSSGTTLALTNIGDFLATDVIELTLDSGAIHDCGEIVSTDPSAGTMVITNAVPSAAAIGRLVRVRIGDTIAMTEFGTPKVGEFNFGFEGPLAANHGAPRLVHDLDIDVEITLVFGTLQWFEIICATMKNVTDCD
jgi:hypothetical protein